MIVLNAHVAFAGQRLKGHVNLGHTSSDVLTMLYRGAIGFALLCEFNKLPRRFIEANHRMVLIIGPLINTEHLFHAADKLRTPAFRNHPLLYPPGLDFVFFSTVATLV